jgi:hypothetical protein
MALSNLLMIEKVETKKPDIIIQLTYLVITLVKQECKTEIANQLNLHLPIW